MSYLISLLDKSPVDPGRTSTEALHATASLAAKAEEWGYHRFWVAEHHNIAGLANSAPETLIAYLLAKTSKIRIGSGGDFQPACQSRAIPGRSRCGQGTWWISVLHQSVAGRS